MPEALLRLRLRPKPNSPLVRSTSPPDAPFSPLEAPFSRILLRSPFLLTIVWLERRAATAGARSEGTREGTVIAIEATSLTRNFNGLCAVDHISFAVAPGEIFGFLGPNGAGKTTTIRMLTGQLRPSDGRAKVMGCDVVTERQELKPQIGVVWEYQNLYERLSARDNLVFAARLYGVDKDRVVAMLERVGLADRSRDRLKTYSNGMKQRLLIARALLHSPKVLFLDEPTRGLDPGVAREIRSLVANLAGEGVTVFLTTHYMDEADRLSNRVAILDRGRIVAIDTPERLKAQHGPAATLEDVFVQLTGRELQQG
jgi:ABC-2 type transport system ATP-binding protein